MDKSPFHSPSPQDSPRLSSFTQHHRPVIAVHSGEHAAVLLTRSLSQGRPSGPLNIAVLLLSPPGQATPPEVPWFGAPGPDPSLGPQCPRLYQKELWAGLAPSACSPYLMLGPHRVGRSQEGVDTGQAT